MRASRFFLPTLRQAPSEAELRSHSLLLRGGFIKRQAAGVYTYLPLGLRVLNKVANIVREEANAAGAIEMLMPTLVPFELLQETGRDQVEVLYKTTDRTGRDFALGFTHEEVVTDVVRAFVSSYRQMPLCLYQIQTKFRDEQRPRAGLIRAKEFSMFDAYSFDTNGVDVDAVYDRMANAYKAMFRRMGLDVLMCEAEAGDIGGSHNHEFMVIAPLGEDSVLLDDVSGVAANAERCDIGGEYALADPSDEMAMVETPGKRTVEEVTVFLKVGPENLVKTLLLRTGERRIAALIRGDRELNTAKLARRIGGGKPEMLTADEARSLTGADVGFVGPVGLEGCEVIADKEIAAMSGFIVGANRNDAHLRGVSHGRDFAISSFEDIRVAVDGDVSTSGGVLREVRGIEVGHIFQLGTKYSEAMKALFDDGSGGEQPIIMGCYGLGIGRSMQSVAEISNDDNGIIWPITVAPFEVVVVPVNSEDEAQKRAAEGLYEALQEKGVDALLDDRDERAGSKFKDADLLGLPLRAVCGRGLASGVIEVKWRNQGESIEVPLGEAAERIAQMVREERAKFK
ncbi:MAG: proline--tRNA ligase [Armatimonadota bacterium]|nr:proline--tRNA ligase [Armatimonadota bacterium]